MAPGEKFAARVALAGLLATLRSVAAQVRGNAASDGHFHKTLFDAFGRFAFRKKVFRAIDERHADLDDWVKQHNEARTDQGRWRFGKLDGSAARPAQPERCLRVTLCSTVSFGSHTGLHQPAIGH